MIRLAIGIAALAFLAAAQAPKPKNSSDSRPPLSRTDPAEAEALARVLRTLLQKHVPDPISKSSQNWGKQKAVTVVRRQREGLRVWSEAVQEFRNDGHWRRTTVRIPEPDRIGLTVTKLTHPEDGKILATVGIAAERVDVRFEQQLWRNGLRLYGGETRAHCKGGLVLKAEVTTKTEFKKGSFLPEVTMKLRLTDADIYYDKIVFDHTAGLDGDAAKAIGDALLDVAKAVKPDLEKNLREKAEAAVVKAVGIREFKVVLDKLLQPKPKK